jgi:hypothetical protein
VRLRLRNHRFGAGKRRGHLPARRLALILTLGIGAVAVPVPALADSVNVVDPTGALGGIVGTVTKPPIIVPLLIPATFNGLSGVVYSNSSSQPDRGATAALQLTPYVATGQLNLGGCALTATPSSDAGALLAQDPTPSYAVTKGAVNFTTFEGVMVVVNSCSLEGTAMVQYQTVDTVINYTNDPRLGGNTIWGSVQLINQNPTIPNQVDGPSIMGFFTISSNGTYINGAVSMLTSVLGAGLSVAPAGSPCGRCIIRSVANLSGLPAQIVYGTGSLATTDAAGAAPTPAADGCAQTTCTHEVAFYQGPTVGAIRRCGNSGELCYFDPSIYLGFHFSTDPLINQNNMTQHNACKKQNPDGTYTYFDCCPSGCFPYGGDPAATATAMGYPGDDGSYVKNFNVAAWLPPQNWQDPKVCNFCAYIQKEEFDFRYNTRDFQELSRTPTTCPSGTTDVFTAAADFGLEAVPAVVANPAVAVGAAVLKRFTNNDQQQACSVQTASGSDTEDYWSFHPDHYAENPRGVSQAVGVQVSLYQKGGHPGASATATHGWAAIDYVNMWCPDTTGGYNPCTTGNVPEYPGEVYVTSNPSGLTKVNSQVNAPSDEGDATAGDIVIDQYKWKLTNPSDPVNSPRVYGPNGYTQDWIPAEPAPAVAPYCNIGLQQQSLTNCAPKTVLSAGEQGEFFLGYGGQQRANSSHTLEVFIKDLADNLPTDHQDNIPDNELAFGGPGTNLAGITVSNRFWWLAWGDQALNTMVDTSAHEIDVFDDPTYDQDQPVDPQTGKYVGVTQGTPTDPMSIPIATFAFGVEPCGAAACPQDSSTG